MPYIIIDLQGHQSAGGYLRVDGGAQIALSDDLIIKVAPGTHHLGFSSENAASRNLSKLNVAVGNYRTAMWNERNAVDGKISATFDENSVMFLTVVSDASGHILDLPQYRVQEMDDEDIAELEEMYVSRIAAAEKYEKDTVGKEFILCLLLGGLGAHKFYRGRFGMGIFYLLTGGGFGIGWLFDTVKLLFRFIKAKKG